jgi:hypothetical protein
MNIAFLYIDAQSARQNPHQRKDICPNRRNGLGHFIVPKTHSLGVNLALQEFSWALGRCRPAMQNQFGSEVCARKSDAG